MINVVAALGVGQLTKIENTIKDKNRLHLNYEELLSDLEITFQNKNEEHLFWVISLLFINKKVKKKVTDIFDINKIGWRPLFYPVHLMPMYKKYKYIEKSGFTSDLYKRGIIIPSYPTLRNVDIKKIIFYIKKAILD